MPSVEVATAVPELLNAQVSPTADDVPTDSPRAEQVFLLPPDSLPDALLGCLPAPLGRDLLGIAAPVAHNCSAKCCAAGAEIEAWLALPPQTRNGSTLPYKVLLSTNAAVTSCAMARNHGAMALGMSSAVVDSNFPHVQACATTSAILAFSRDTLVGAMLLGGDPLKVLGDDETVCWRGGRDLESFEGVPKKLDGDAKTLYVSYVAAMPGFPMIGKLMWAIAAKAGVDAGLERGTLGAVPTAAPVYRESWGFDFDAWTADGETGNFLATMSCALQRSADKVAREILVAKHEPIRAMHPLIAECAEELAAKPPQAMTDVDDQPRCAGTWFADRCACAKAVDCNHLSVFLEDHGVTRGQQDLVEDVRGAMRAYIEYGQAKSGGKERHPHIHTALQKAWRAIESFDHARSDAKGGAQEALGVVFTYLDDIKRVLTGAGLEVAGAAADDPENGFAVGKRVGGRKSTKKGAKGTAKGDPSFTDDVLAAKLVGAKRESLAFVERYRHLRKATLDANAKLERAAAKKTKMTPEDLDQEMLVFLRLWEGRSKEVEPCTGSW